MRGGAIAFCCCGLHGKRVRGSLEKKCQHVKMRRLSIVPGLLSAALLGTPLRRTL